jgi:hypothetical protein
VVFGGAVITLIAVVLLAPLSATAMAVLVWGPMVGGEIAARRQRARRLDDDGLPATPREVVGPRWVEPALAAAFAVWTVGFALLVGNVVGFFFRADGPIDSAAVFFGSVLFGGASIVLITHLVRARHRRVVAPPTRKAPSTR